MVQCQCRPVGQVFQSDQRARVISLLVGNNSFFFPLDINKAIARPNCLWQPFVTLREFEIRAHRNLTITMGVSAAYSKSI